MPALYAASDAELAKLNSYAKAGGHLLYTFKIGFSDQNTKVRSTSQPGGISEAAGVKYTEFTIPTDVSLEGDPFHVGEKDNNAMWWMEFLKPITATVLARCKHASWPAYAAVTRNNYGKGVVTYVGFMPTDALNEKILSDCLVNAGITDLPSLHHPLIIRSGLLHDGHAIHYLFNYSTKAQQALYAFEPGTELLSGRKIGKGAAISLQPWGFVLVEETGKAADHEPTK